VSVLTKIFGRRGSGRCGESAAKVNVDFCLRRAVSSIGGCCMANSFREIDAISLLGRDWISRC
jgi:hypothetical protein